LAPSHGVGATGGNPAPTRHIDSVNRSFHLDDLQRVTLKANGHDIPTWVMDTDAKREEGMMWLTSDDVADNDGMIFVFSEAKPQSFWMKNTILALDLIFISKDKKVLNVQHGRPQDTSPLPSAGDAMYVLEMKDGAAKRLGIGPGTVFTIPDSVKSK
jgi:uncharacterized membrane protein (UPF0127 family)